MGNFDMRRPQSDHFLALNNSLRAAIESNDKTQIMEFARLFKNFNKNIELMLFPKMRVGLREAFITQNLRFYIDILPFLESVFTRFPRLTSFKILDVGPGSGAGTNLIAQLYSSEFLGYTVDVDVIDIQDLYFPFLAGFCQSISNAYNEDVFTLPHKSYDIVICSHVIEHVHDPMAFIDKLRLISKEYVLLYAPFEEPLKKMSPSHINSFDINFINEINPVECHILNSPAWGAFKDPPYKTFVAILKCE